MLTEGLLIRVDWMRGAALVISVTVEIAIALLISAGAMVLFVTGWLRADLVAVLVLLAVTLTGLVGPSDAASGFSSPAVIALCGIFILSAGLFRSGVAGWLAVRMESLGGAREWRLVLVIMGVIAVMSFFMNTMGIVALMLPAVMDLARRTGLAPSRLLMPLTFGALLGGLTTTFATLPNLLASTALRDAGLKPFGLFDFIPVGGAAAVCGIAFMVLAGRRLLPIRDLQKESGTLDLRKHYELHEHLFILEVPPASLLSGKTLHDTRLGSALGLQVVGIIRNGQTQLAPGSATTLQERDLLLVQGTPDQLNDLDGWRSLVLGEGDTGIERWFPAGVEFAEIRIASGSPFANLTLPWLDLRRRWGVNVVAIRRGTEIRRGSLQEWSLREGDILLVQGIIGKLEALREIGGLADYRITPRDEVASRYDLQSRLFTLELPPEGSPLAGHSLSDSRLGEALGLVVLAISRNGSKIIHPGPDEMLRAGDCLLVEGRSEHLALLRGLKDLRLEREVTPEYAEFESEQLGLCEAVLSPRTTLAGKNLRQIRFRDRYGLSVMGLWRAGQAVTTKLGDVPLQFGDALLLYGPREKLRLLGRDPEFIVLMAEAQEPPRMEKAPLALIAVAAFLVPVAADWLPIHLGALLGALLMILFGCLRIEEAYPAIEWRSAVVIAGLLPLGVALERTGAAELAASLLVDLVADRGPVALLAGLFLLTALGTCLVPGPVLVMLLSPLVLRAAAATGTSPHALMIAMALAASASFLSPISHPSNVLIMGPGGYRFADFLKVGIPMTLLLLFVVLLTVPWMWPLRVEPSLNAFRELEADVVPKGHGENSPAFQRRERMGQRPSPEGTAELLKRVSVTDSAVPSGRHADGTRPSVETLGYSLLSLRDNGRKCLREFPKGIKPSP